MRKRVYRKTLKIIFEAVPVIIMIFLIYIIKNDFILLGCFTLIIFASFFIKLEKKDILVFFFGVIIMTFFEFIFIGAGVEIFLRNSFFEIMPIWLPILWGYGFVAIKRIIKILEK
jgi:hypothetical protein